MRRFRERKRQRADAAGVTVSKLPKPATRSEAEKNKARKEHKAAVQRRYRANLSAKKKRAIRQKDAQYQREKYAYKKEQKKQREERSRRKREQKLKTPAKVADSVEDMIEKSTPKTRQALKERSIYDRKTRRSINHSLQAIGSSNKKTMLDVLRKTTLANKSGLARAANLRRATLSYKPKGRRNVNRKLWQQDKDKIEAFYKRMDISSLMPNKRKSADDNPFYIMQIPIYSAYKEFCFTHPEVDAGFISFYNAKPNDVHKLSKMKWFQCICNICANVKYMCQTVSKSLVRHNFDMPRWLPTTRTIGLGLETLCHGAETYANRCLQQNCKDCGRDNLLEDLSLWVKDDVSDVLKWKEWKMVEEEKKGKLVKSMKLLEQIGNRSAVVESLRQKLEGFGAHSFFATWQQQQHKENLNILGNGEVRAVVDFSENFTCTQQEEAQSAYYGHSQVTIHPCVCHYKVGDEVVRDSVVFVSDELKHDAACVKTFTNRLVVHLQAEVEGLKKLYI